MNLQIQNYPVFVRIGHFPQERLQGQNILISLDIELPPLPESVDLDATVDYCHIFSLINDLLKDQEIYLLETAVNRLGRGLLSRFSQLKKVCVTIEKPILPEGVNRGARICLSETFQGDS